MTTRRYGSDSARNRELLLVAAEELMREEGYPAVTSRRLAARAELKPQLVHYYFPTMDSLYLELFRRSAANSLHGLDSVLESEDPLQALWDQISNKNGVVLSYEMVGLANHRKDLRAEIAEHGNVLRARKIAVLERIMKNYGGPELPFPASFATVLIDSLARNLALEAALGVHAGHAEAMHHIRQFFDLLKTTRTANSPG